MASAEKTVVVIGLGYAGIAIATKLDAVAHVVAIDRHDGFFHNFAGPLAMTDAVFNERLRGLKYTNLLKRGEVVQGTVVEVNDSRVRLEDGREIKFDYAVIATGGTYNGIIKSSKSQPSETLANFDRYREAMTQAKNILVVGAGLAGIEYAGFAAVAFPNAHVTLVHSGPEVLSHVPNIAPNAQADVHTKLAAAGVEIVLNERIALPEGEDFSLPKARTLKSASGRTFASDVQLFLVGLAGLNTKVLPSAWSPQLVTSGGLKVNSFLQLEGHPTIFAAGDVTATGALKTSVVAGAQADVVVKNIQQLLATNGTPTTDLAPFAAGHTMLLACLSQTTGTAQGIPFDQWSITGWLGNLLSRVKGGDFFIGRIAATLHVTV